MYLMLIDPANLERLQPYMSVLNTKVWDIMSDRF